MTMTPVSISEHSASPTGVGVTISLHLPGMYASSPVVGRLSDRIGHVPVAVAGQDVFLVSTLLSGLGHESVAMMTSGPSLPGLGRS